MQACVDAGADVVIDKAARGADAFWDEARTVAPEGYIAIFDANGVSTLQQSYEHLALCGRLIIYGFHSNLPRGIHTLNPFAWLKMAFLISRMPKFDPMALVLESKA
eukprot:11184216-Prorocentrum_lima.AAC.1